MIFLERHIPGKDYTSVIFDNERMIFQTVMEILKGAESISKKDLPMLVVDKELPSSDRACMKGFLDACEKYGIDGADRILKVGCSAECSFCDLGEILGGLAEMPSAFIATSKVMAESLMETNGIYGYKAKIYVLTGDGWSSHAAKGDIVELRQNAVELGEKGAELLIEYIKSNILFENKQVVLQKEEEKPEKVYTSKRYPNQKIKLLLYSIPSVNSLIQLSKDFTNHFGIDVDFEYLAYDELHKKIKETSAKQKSDVDIFMLDYQLFNTDYTKNIFRELNSFIDQDSDGFLSNFIPVVRNEFTNYRQKIYTLPILATTQFLFYRRGPLRRSRTEMDIFQKVRFRIAPAQNLDRV